MVGRWVASAVALAACVATYGDAFAGAGSDVLVTSCPETARRNTTVDITVELQNWDQLDSITVTKGALGLHLGNVTLVGPLVFSVPPGTIVPLAALAWEPGTQSMTVPVKIPRQARPRTFITVGLGFFGTKGADPARREIGSDACSIEIIP